MPRLDAGSDGSQATDLLVAFAGNPKGDATVLRRDLLVFMAAGTAALAAPAVRATGLPTVLKYVPQVDLALLDPCFTPALVTHNHAYLVYDTLYGVDDAARPQPQMAEGHV